ncbi:hypothetical protein LXL04_037492 [Taraxacum kok-saghyz]
MHSLIKKLSPTLAKDPKVIITCSFDDHQTFSFLPIWDEDTIHSIAKAQHKYQIAKTPIITAKTSDVHDFTKLMTQNNVQGVVKEFRGMLRNYVWRESLLYFAERLTEYFKRPNGEGPEIYLKREDFHPPGLYNTTRKTVFSDKIFPTNSCKINNVIGQALLAKTLGKTRIVTETGVGEHGVATATICSHYGLQCVIYMGVKDMEKQAIKLFRMMNDGAKFITGPSDARPFAIRDWLQNMETTHYLSSSGGGPHPYPNIVREFHSVIGKETRKQAMEIWGGKPDHLCLRGEEVNVCGVKKCVCFLEDKRGLQRRGSRSAGWKTFFADLFLRRKTHIKPKTFRSLLFFFLAAVTSLSLYLLLSTTLAPWNHRRSDADRATAGPDVDAVATERATNLAFVTDCSNPVSAALIRYLPAPILSPLLRSRLLCSDPPSSPPRRRPTAHSYHLRSLKIMNLFEVLKFMKLCYKAR